jgi:hypothetical protein
MGGYFGRGEGALLQGVLGILVFGCGEFVAMMWWIGWVGWFLEGRFFGGGFFAVFFDLFLEVRWKAYPASSAQEQGEALFGGSNVWVANWVYYLSISID